MRRLLTLAALLTLLLPAAAHAAPRYVVRGAGFGHGIGMSQYGAYGFAKHGRSYRQILAHYYRGTELSKAGGQRVRVLLASGRDISFSGAASAGGRGLAAGRSYRVRASGGALELRGGGGVVARSRGALTVSPSKGSVRLLGRATNGVSGGSYRGALELRASGSRVLAINVVGLEDYLRGVVPAEVPPSWPAAALQAQAVAARSYALATRRRGAFDHHADTRSQVYRGVNGERPSTDAAVRGTADEVLRSGGRVAQTFFFSTSGGQTESVQNVFGGGPRAYLVSVPDPFDSESPRHRWRMSFTTAQMQARLRGIVKGRLRGIKVLRRGSSPRIRSARVDGSRGSVRVSGATLRTRLGLPSTWAYFKRG